jgi:hypothetical protein
MSATFLKHFNSITDHRIERCKKNMNLSIFFCKPLVLYSLVQKAGKILKILHLKLDWLKKYGSFNEGIPKHDTIARIISRLKPDEIECAFQSWISSLIETTGADIIAIDGKIARRSFKRNIDKVRYIPLVRVVANTN